MYSVAYSPAGEKIISGSFDKSIRIWDAKTWTFKMRWEDIWVNLYLQSTLMLIQLI